MDSTIDLDLLKNFEEHTMEDDKTVLGSVLIRSSLSMLTFANCLYIPNTKGLRLQFASPIAALSRRPRNISSRQTVLDLGG